MDEQRLEIFMAASLIGILANPQRHAPRRFVGLSF